jgi:predicted PurR-regulated permease PerM
MPDCTGKCDAHKDTTARLHILEQKYKVVQDNTNTVSRLSDKVSLLLTVLGIIIFIVSAGAIYTYTGVNDFDTKYSSDMIKLHRQLAVTNNNNRDLIISSIDKVEENINIKISELDSRINQMSNDMVRIKTQLEDYHESLPKK